MMFIGTSCGKIAGYAPGGSTIVRFNASGTLDLSFSVDGTQNTRAGVGESVFIQPDGKIIVAGYGFSVGRGTSALETPVGDLQPQ